MYTRFWAAFVGTVMGLALVLPVFAPLSAAKVQAAGPNLEIAEINWAGSSSSPVDTWVKLFNAGTETINLNTTPYHLLVNGSEIATLNSGLVLSHGFYLVSRLSVGAESTLAVLPDQVVPTLTLTSVNALYQLRDSNNTLVDQAGSQVAGQPFAGSTGPTIASMVRRDALSDGTLASSWFTSHTIGTGLKASTNQQFGMPANSSSLALNGQINQEMSLPTNLSISPLTPTSPTPTISGTIPGQSIFATLTAQRVDAVGRANYSLLPNPTDGSFSFTLPSPLTPGLYRFQVTLSDALGNRSQSVDVPILDIVSPQHLYVISPTSAVVPTPTLDAYPALVNTATVTLTGTVQSGVALVISVNGFSVSQDVLPADQGRFSLPVSLIPNFTNRIEVRARDASGNISQPAIAVITQDSLAPVLNSFWVKVNSNPVGTADTVQGQFGATEPGAMLDLFADAALTQKIGSTQANSDGSFGPLSLGDNQYAVVYLVARDAAGNLSQPLALTNTIVFSSSQNLQIGIILTNIGPDHATFAWQKIAGAVDYHFKYKVVGQAYSPVVDLCPVGTTCSFQREIVNLIPNSQYTFAIAAVDQFGNESAYTEQSFKTLQVTPQPVPAGLTNPPIGGQPLTPVASTSTAPETSKPAVGQVSPTPSPTPTPEVATNATPNPETGQVGGGETQQNQAARNYTPWIILAVLVALAVLATTGYFYWFGGEAGEAALASAIAERESRAAKQGAEANATDTSKDRGKESKNAPPDKPKEGEKRW